MSPSAFITVRARARGKSYVVRYRAGGRYTPLVHAGSFKTMKAARERRDFIISELAAGRDPREALRALTAPKPEPVTAAALADSWLASRVDLKPRSRRLYGHAVEWFKGAFPDQPIEQISFQDLQAVVAESILAASSLRTYFAAIRQLFDYASVDPNPARDKRLRLPKVEREPMNPPPLVHVRAILEAAAPRYRLALRILAETGVRVGELLAWTWGDVDIHESQILVPKGKTKAARRWVAIEHETMNLLLDTVPPDDRARTRRLFQLGESTLRSVMHRACTNAGIPAYSPHDFRHRHISVLLKRGLSRAEVAVLVGHSNTNELATYEHVVLEDA